jgi:hypothetical protein
MDATIKVTSPKLPKYIVEVITFIENKIYLTFGNGQKSLLMN